MADNQGSVRMLLDNQGNVVNQITYDAFGNITLETHPEVNFRFGYTGRELDPETGLYNYRTRLYDPNIGQFIGQDSIGFAGGDSNLYRYVVNNPVNYTDPYGEDLYSVLNTADQFAAGFADTVTLGLSTKFREKAYGDLATRNHQGGVFNAGRVTGAAASLAVGLNTPANFARNLSWAQKAAIAYDVAATGYGAYDATTKIRQGCATPLDALNFLPVAGYGLSRLKGLKNAKNLSNLDKFGDANVNRNLQNSQQQLDQGASDVTDALDELNMKGKPISPLEKTFEHALNPEKYLNDIAEKYNINLSGSGQNIEIKFDPNLPPGVYGKTREVDRGKTIIIGKDALADEGTAANTIAHELSHARDYLRGNIHKPHGVESSLGDGTVYGAGNALQDFIEGNR